jgi:hypothetical protein
MGTHSNVGVSRRRSGYAVAAVLLMGANSCGAQTQPAELSGNLERAIFTLGATSLAIMLPKGAEISNSASSDREIMIRDVSKSKRLERLLVIATASKGFRARHDRQVTLANGGRLEFQITDDVGGGSGGPTAELAGPMEIDSHVFSITCTDQDELRPDPSWCLP